MSVAALLLVKDECDILPFVLRHLAAQVDEVFLLDNSSSDGSREIAESFPEVKVFDDPEVGYWQSKKMTALAQRAREAGHDWVLPCDADEYWYADGRPLRDYLDGLTPDVQVVTGRLWNHFPTALDPVEENPFLRMGWRKREHGALPKICCRARPDLVIEAGNHGARMDGIVLKVPGLSLRHYSWRTAEQYLRKIRNGEAAYAATNLAANIGSHWRMFEDASDEEIVEHFNRWFFFENPEADRSLVYDPV